MAEILTEQIDALKREKPPNQGDKELRQKLPKGVVLDKDGKPCRTCTSLSDWRALTRMKSSSSTAAGATAAAAAATATATSSSSSSNPGTTALHSTKSALTSTTSNPAPAADTLQATPADCPADVETLGRSTWTLLHTMAATYPTTASAQQQNDMSSFMSLFSKLYPCWVCADDFRAWMNDASGKNRPRVRGRAEFGNWMCEAHNEVNRKLGKKEFDCAKWEERWRTGWKDGRCD